MILMKLPVSCGNFASDTSTSRHVFGVCMSIFLTLWRASHGKKMWTGACKCSLFVCWYHHLSLGEVDIVSAGVTRASNAIRIGKLCNLPQLEILPVCYRKESGLPFFETILMPALPKSAGLPVGLTQQTKKRLQDGR